MATAAFKTRRKTSIMMLFKIFIVYVGYLAFWKCPVTQPLGCGCTPCYLVHQVYDTQLHPLWVEHGQPQYAKIEPYTTPVVAAVAAHAEPHLHRVKSEVANRWAKHAKPHVDVVKAKLEPYVSQAEQLWGSTHPHRSAVSARLGPHLSAAIEHAKSLLCATWKVVAAKLRELDAFLHPHIEKQIETSSSFLSVQARAAAAKLQQQWHQGLEGLVGRLSKHLPGDNLPAAEVTLSESKVPVPTLDEASEPVNVEEKVPVKQAPVSKETVKIQTVPLSSSSSSSASASASASSSSAHGTVASGSPAAEASDYISTQRAPPAPPAAAPAQPPRKKLSWPERVERTANGAIKNLEQDSHDAQEHVIAESKPKIVEQLRELSLFGEEAARELTDLTLKVEADEAEYENDMDLYALYDKKAQKIHNLMMNVRGVCEDMAGVAIGKMTALRQDAADSLEDFFEIVLAEAGKDAAAHEGDDDDSEWLSWKGYTALKKQLNEVRERVAAYEPDMEVVNVALRESQQAAILLAQDVTGHIKALRGRAQFYIQQKGLREAKENQQPIDAVYYEELEDEAEVETEAQPEADLDELDAQPEANPDDLDELDAEIDPESTTYVTSVVYKTRFNTHPAK